jgi:hypothetical protein
MTPEQAAVKHELDRIESALHTLLRAMEQERADLGTADYGRAEELARIAGQLEQVEGHWTCNGPECTE